VTLVSFAAVFISILAIAFTWKRPTLAKLLLSGLLLIAHLGACLYYYLYSQNAVADASGYYFASHIWQGQPFSFGTIAVVKFVQLLKVKFDATYLDCFLLFQSFGFAGIVIMARVFEEIESFVGVAEHRGYLALLFLPSAQFWTAAIGKDAPLFLGVSLSVWAMLSFRRRIPQFCAALAIMVLFRPHIALMAVTALAGAAFFGQGTSAGRRMGLLAIALIGFGLLVGPVQDSLKVDVTSTTSVSAFLDKNNSIYATVAGTTSLGHASFAVRTISLLFRPFFFDAHGGLGLIASVENLGVVLAFIYTLLHLRDLIQLVRRVLFIRFALLFAFILLFSLVLVYYNVGLGLRQRVMAYPMIFSILVALWSMRRSMATPGVQYLRPNLMVAPNRNRAVPEL
jgi:hypothetical protein